MLRERLRQNLTDVQGRIAEAAQRSGRSPHDVALVVVTKRHPPERVRPLVEFGVKDFGENYPQELWKKVDQLGDLDVRWHLIGHLQGNKAKKTLPMVTMIHSVDSLKLLNQLDALETETAGREFPSVCLQVNTSDEAAKHGWSPEELLADADAIANVGRVPIVGLMTMAAWGTSSETARPSFVRLRRLREELRSRTGLALEHLSMGMSGDFETAIEEGATLVRIGSALFEGIDE
jgi:pyridoxal phosphate enzyme (YggS family)